MRNPALIVISLMIPLLAGCGEGTDRPTPTGAEVQADAQRRQQAIANNPAIPAAARDRVNASIDGGKR